MTFYIAHSGVKIESGKIYDQITSPQGKVFLGNNAGKNRVFESHGSHDFEVRLSAKSIIFNFETIGEWFVDGLKQSAKKYWQRSVFSGKFDYDNAGKFLGGKVYDFATWDYGIFRSDSSEFEWGSVYTSKEGIEVKPIPASIWATKAIILNSHKLFDYTANYGVNGFTMGDPKGNFFNHKISQFFETEWWESPFLEPSQSPEDSNASDYIRSDFVVTSSWSDTLRINLDRTGSSTDSVIQAKQVTKEEHASGWVGSIVTGTSEDDIIRGLAGFDQLLGKAGDDLIHGGNGRDIIDGGIGSDELHGDFGWNTYKDQEDSSKDLIAIKSDQHLSNFWYGKAGNSPNGEKADFIEGLDAIDEIKIIGVATKDLSFKDGITAKGVSGIGIYAKGALEAVYTGGNLSLGQITQMTSGDDSAAAMANQIWSYWGDNAPPALLA